ncbi:MULTISPECIES: hypothetical protein [unclassified Streptomyces]|uniref:ATP-binding protein n=1 Tax=unclassified Streptomyces TaxID=2593676 RepID=UPI00099EC5E2|nr:MULTISPECIES: hypothetical protein [unclassified Streptomyces]
MKYPHVWTCADGFDDGPGTPSAREAGGLLGRAGELAELRTALSDQRQVTVTGPAGVGKSRLAAAVAAPFAGGPWQATVRVRWHDGVPVAPGALAARVARALTAAVGAPPGAKPADVTVAACAAAAHGLLLVLDDVDPVHAECAGLVQRLLMAVPALRVLVTARRALGLGAERVVRLGPLAVDASSGSSEPAPAVELFLARARGGPPVAEGDMPDVRRVCRILEGVPLAIELAAGRLGDRTVRELADRLETDQCWLAGPGPVLRRHRSLRASVGAVHALCEPAVRKVWHRASVFAGSFTEAAAVHLCAGGDIEPQHVPSCLALLSATGVLQVIGEPGAARRPRYRMVRAARDFGAERLRGAGESQHALARHAIHFRGVAAVAETLWHTGLQRQAVQIVLDEHDDLMALAEGALAVAARAHHLPRSEHPSRAERAAGAEHSPGAEHPDGAGDTAGVVDTADADTGAVHPADAENRTGPGRPAAGAEHGAGFDRSPGFEHPPGRELSPGWEPSPGFDRSPDSGHPADVDRTAEACHAGCAERVEAAVETVLHLWFWWAAHERGPEGGRLLLGLLPHLPTDSPLTARGRWLAAWLVAAHDPRTAHRLLDLAWPAAVMAGDDALVGRIAHVHGTLAWRRRDREAAFQHYRLAADTVPEEAYGGPPPAVSLAALSVVQAHGAPDDAARTADRALARPSGGDDLWAAALAQYARAFADHRAGRTGRAWHRTRRALARLDDEPGAAPQAHTALRQLLDHIESATDTSRGPSDRHRPFVPAPRTGAQSVRTVQDGAGRW